MTRPLGRGRTAWWCEINRPPVRPLPARPAGEAVRQLKSATQLAQLEWGRTALLSRPRRLRRAVLRNTVVLFAQLSVSYPARFGSRTARWVGVGPVDRERRSGLSWH